MTTTTTTMEWEEDPDVEFQKPLLVLPQDHSDDPEGGMESTTTRTRHDGGGTRSWQPPPPSSLLQCLLWMIQLTLAVVLVVLGVTQWNDCSAIPTLPLWSLTFGLWQLAVTTTTIVAARGGCNGGGDKEEETGTNGGDCTSSRPKDEEDDDMTTTTIIIMESLWIGYGLVLPPLFVSSGVIATPWSHNDSCCAPQLYWCSLYVVLSFLCMLAGMAFLRLVRATRRRRRR